MHDFLLKHQKTQRKRKRTKIYIETLPFWRSEPDSNRCRRFCRPLPKPLSHPTRPKDSKCNKFKSFHKQTKEILGRLFFSFKRHAYTLHFSINWCCMLYNHYFRRLQRAEISHQAVNYSLCYVFNKP